MKNKILKLLFMIWVIVWIAFTAREIFMKGALKDYAALARQSLEGKHSYIMGEHLYEFIAFCNENLPREAAYSFVGLEDGSIEKRRAVYYLYPHFEENASDFLLVFDRPDFTAKGYRMFASLDKARYILVRNDNRTDAISNI